MDGTAITNVTSWTGMFQTMSQRLVQSGTGYQQTSLATGASGTIQWSSAVSNATSIGIISFMNSADSGNIVFSYMQSTQLDYTTTYDHLDGYIAALQGTLPNFLEQRVVPSRRLQSGSPGRGWRFTGSFYSSFFYVVSSLLPTTTTTNIVVTVDGVSQTFSDVQVINPASYLLPITDTLVWSPSHFTQYVIDAPPEAVTVVPFAPAREYQITYPMTTDLASATQSQWVAQWNTSFNQEAGGNFASAYKVALDTNVTSPTFGQCSGRIPFYGGSWCLRKTFYEFAIFGQFANPNVTGTIVMFDKASTYKGTVTFPGDKVEQLIQSECPLKKQVVQSANQLDIQLTNPLASPNTIRVNQIGACGPQVHQFVIGPSATATLAAFPCPEAPAGQPDVLQIFAEPSVGVFVDCNITTALDLNVTSDAFFGAGSASLDVTTTVQNVTQDRLLIYLAQVRYELIQEVITASQLQFQTLQQVGFQLSNVTIEGFQGIINTGLGLVASTAATVAQAYQASANLSLPSEATDARYAAAQAQGDALAMNANAALQRLAISAQQTLAQGKNLQSLSKIDINTLKTFVTGMNGFINALVEAESLLVCNITINNNTCFAKIAQLTVQLGSLSPDNAQCAPAGLEGLLGGNSQTSQAFAQIFGGCAAGNLLGPLFTLVLVTAGGLSLFFLLMYFLYRPPGTKSTFKSDEAQTILLDQYMTVQEESVQQQIDEQGKESSPAVIGGRVDGSTGADAELTRLIPSSR
jgi:hypothetical protein